MEERAVCFGPESLGMHLSGRHNFLRLELLLRSPPVGALPESVPDPFLRVRGESRLGALFLSRLRSSDGALDRLVTLKILWDGRSPGGGRVPPVDANPIQVRLFQEEYRALRLLREPDADPILRLAPFDLKTGLGVELPRHPPLLFCKRRQLFFTPRCSLCAGPLQDCRNDELLLQVGLQPYTGTGVRYIHCPSCASQNPDARFFSAGADAPGSAGGRLGDMHDLLASFGELARRSPAGVPDFPCAECESTLLCYPGDAQGDAERVLLAFSFHDFYAFVQESLPWRFDECCDLLGGREPSEILAGSAAARTERGGGGVPLFFGSAADVRAPLEVLLLKLALCRQLCLGVRAVHSRFDRPHLNLCPDAVWMGMGEQNLAFPGAWNLRLRVTPPDQPVPVPSVEPGEELLYRWPARPNPFYAPRKQGAKSASAGYDLFGVGMLVIRALLGSRGQSDEFLSGVLERALSDCSSAAIEERAQAVLDRLPPSVTEPNHLLWEPLAGECEGPPPPLWRGSLLVGLDLICRWDAPDPDAALDRAIGVLSDLEKEARYALFLDQPRRGREIQQVLDELLRDDTWLAAVEARDEPRAPATEPTPSAPQPSPVQVPRAAPAPPPPAEDFEATVILGGGRGRVPEYPAPQATSEPLSPVTPAQEFDFEATLIAGQGAPTPTPTSAPQPEPAPTTDGSEFEETIILPASLRKAKGAGER